MVASIVAGAALYVVNSVLLSIVLRLVHGGTVRAAWREHFAWLWPQYLGIGALAAALVIAERRLGAVSALIFGVPVVLLWIAERQYLSRTRRTVLALRERNTELEQAQTQLRLLLEAHDALLWRAHSSILATIYSLARAIRVRDPQSVGHAERASRAAEAVGAALGLGESNCVALRLGVLVHDIGNVDPRPGDSKPPGTYPEVSCYILGDLELPPIIREVIRSHLERYDGAGGPDGLAGEAIPLAARIAAVALAFESYTIAACDDEYPIEAALAHIEARAGTRFCPLVTRTLRGCMQADPALRRYFGGVNGAALPRRIRFGIPQEVN